MIIHISSKLTQKLNISKMKVSKSKWINPILNIIGLARLCSEASNYNINNKTLESKSLCSDKQLNSQKIPHNDTYVLSDLKYSKHYLDYVKT